MDASDPPAPPARAIDRGRIAGADGFRALCCLAVIFTHALIWVKPDYLQGSIILRLAVRGFHGVYGFFVLSGFLLALPYWRCLRSGDPLPSPVAFLVRRVGRIAPALYVNLGLLGLYHGGWADIWLDLTHLTFTSCLFPATFYFPQNSPLWTISVEMQVYVVCGALFALAFRWRSRIGAALVLLLGLGLALWARTLLRLHGPAIQAWIGNARLFVADGPPVVYGPLTGLLYVLVGSLAAAFAGPQREGSSADGSGSALPNRYDVAALLFLYGIANATVNPTGLPQPTIDTRLLAMFPQMPVCIAGLLVCLHRSRILARLLDTWFLRKTAVLSYGIYLWHMPVMLRLTDMCKVPQRFLGATHGEVLAFVAATLAISYTLAAISYYLVEEPFIRRSARLAHRLSKGV
jgi:peptidoglycan/LPS O-acetylase OafA/YrhL